MLLEGKGSLLISFTIFSPLLYIFKFYKLKVKGVYLNYRQVWQTTRRKKNVRTNIDKKVTHKSDPRNDPLSNNIA